MTKPDHGCWSVRNETIMQTDEERLLLCADNTKISSLFNSGFNLRAFNMGSSHCYCTQVWKANIESSLSSARIPLTGISLRR